MVDGLEEQGMETVSQRHLGRKGTDLDLVEQLNIYEVWTANDVFSCYVASTPHYFIIFFPKWEEGTYVDMSWFNLERQMKLFGKSFSLVSVKESIDSV